MWISLSIAAPARFVGAVGGLVSVVGGVVNEIGSPGVALPKTSRAMTWNS
jgi:hypothetical protein